MKKAIALSIFLTICKFLFAQEIEFISSVYYSKEIDRYDRYDYRLIKIEENGIEDTIFRFVAPFDFKRNHIIGRVKLATGNYRLEFGLRPVLNDFFVTYKHEFEVDGKEKRIESDFQFHYRRLWEINLKKVYPNPEGIKIIPLTPFYEGESPLFRLENDTDEIYFGQSPNGHFYGELYRMEFWDWALVERGNYNTSPEDENTLSKYNNVFSWIPDCCNQTKTRKVEATGEYKYIVQIGKKNFEHRDSFNCNTGDAPCKLTKTVYEIEAFFTAEENNQLEIRREIEAERLRILNELLDDTWEEYDDWDLYYWLKIDEKTIKEVREKRGKKTKD